mgnify:CR=1 FL=1
MPNEYYEDLSAIERKLIDSTDIMYTRGKGNVSANDNST